MDVTFYLMLGFGTQGHGFDYTSLFWGMWVGVHIFGLVVVGLSLHLCFLGVVGLSLQLCFWGVVGLTPQCFGGLWV